MAKKVVATLRKEGEKQHTKVVKMIKDENTGAYKFVEKILHNDEVNAFLSKK